MQYFPPALETLVEQFAKLPGVGVKSAQRLAFYVLDMPKEKAQEFAQAILDAHEKIHTCKVCCNLTDDELCPVCRRRFSASQSCSRTMDLYQSGSRGRSLLSGTSQRKLALQSSTSMYR